MNIVQWVSLATAGLSAVAASLAWIAKLRWSKEYRAATEQVLKARDAEVLSLKTQVEVMLSVSSGKILEHATQTKQGLEAIIEDNKNELETARATIEGLKIELDNLRIGPTGRVGLSSGNPGESDAEVGDSAHQVEALLVQLDEVEREEHQLRAKQIAYRILQLETAPEAAKKFEEELNALQTQRALVVDTLEQRRSAWENDRQHAFTMLSLFRDRAAELQGHISEMEAGGAEAACPTCLRPIGDHHSALIAELHDQFTVLSQDGRWWTKRTDQLAQKPDVIAELESLDTQLAIAEADRRAKLDRCRSAMKELEASREELRRLGTN